MCGDYTGGRLKAADAIAVRPLCATIYNCSDPKNCWLEDIATGTFRDTENGVEIGNTNTYGIFWVRAVSVMPGCKFKGEPSKDTGRRAPSPRNNANKFNKCLSQSLSHTVL